VRQTATPLAGAVSPALYDAVNRAALPAALAAWIILGDVRERTARLERAASQTKRLHPLRCGNTRVFGTKAQAVTGMFGSFMYYDGMVVAAWLMQDLHQASMCACMKDATTWPTTPGLDKTDILHHAAMRMCEEQSFAHGTYPALLSLRTYSSTYLPLLLTAIMHLDSLAIQADQSGEHATGAQLAGATKTSLMALQALRLDLMFMLIATFGVVKDVWAQQSGCALMPTWTLSACSALAQGGADSETGNAILAALIISQAQARGVTKNTTEMRTSVVGAAMVSLAYHNPKVLTKPMWRQFAGEGSALMRDALAQDDAVKAIVAQATGSRKLEVMPAGPQDATISKEAMEMLQVRVELEMKEAGKGYVQLVCAVCSVVRHAVVCALIVDRVGNGCVL
jgi:hypothetical protein